MGSKQFVLPSMKSNFLQGGRIASVIKELQGSEEGSQRVAYKTYNRDSFLARQNLYNKDKLPEVNETKERLAKSREAFLASRGFQDHTDNEVLGSKPNTDTSKTEVDSCAISSSGVSSSSTSSGVSSKSNTPSCERVEQSTGCLTPPSSTASYASSSRGTPPPSSATSSLSRGVSPPGEDRHTPSTSRDHSPVHFQQYRDSKLDTGQFTRIPAEGVRVIQINNIEEDSMKSNPTQFNKTNYESKKISINMKPETSDFTDTDEENNEGEQKNYINHAKRSITNMDKKDSVGNSEKDQTSNSDNISLDLSISFSESDSEPDKRSSYQLQRNSTVKTDISKLKGRLQGETSPPPPVRPGSQLARQISNQPNRQLPVQAINKQVVNTAQYDQQPLADHQVSPALTPRMAQNSALIPVMESVQRPLSAGSSPVVNLTRKKTIQKDQPIRCSKPSGYVGFGSLPDQVYRRAVRKGFEFSLMVVGESGLGKSTLVNSMFLTDIYQSSFRSSGQKTIEVEPHTVLLEEGGVKLSLTVVDTPGFGDSVDNTECWAPVITYIENQFDKFLEAEQRVNRIQLVDSRVHACLYFIAPSGHGLRQLDIQDEIKRFKQIILQQLRENSIKIYDFPPTEDPEVDWMREQLPFAVVGSNTVTQDADGKRVRGREYPWGTVNIEDRNHCDFTALRSLLLSHHMQDLKDVTNTVHYETYRCKKLTAMMGEGGPKLESHPLAEIEREVAARRVKVDKLEGEMEEVFNRKVEEKETRLREEQQTEEQRLQEETKEVNNMRDQVQKDRETFMRESGSWQGGLNKYNFRSVKSEESLAGKKKKYGLERVCFKFGRA